MLSLRIFYKMYIVIADNDELIILLVRTEFIVELFAYLCVIMSMHVNNLYS